MSLKKSTFKHFLKRNKLDINFIETHGTGTKLGDQVELSAIGQVFNGCKQPIYFGAAKASVGIHIE